MRLTPAQFAAVQRGMAVTVTVNETECIVLRKDVFRNLQRHAYDDSEWSDKELELLAAEMFDGLDHPEPIA